MNTQALLRSESLITLGAGVFLLPHMSSYMSSQASYLAKSLFTHWSRGGPLPCVDSTMSGQVTVLEEGIVLGGSCKGLISWVCPCVLAHGTR